MYLDIELPRRVLGSTFRFGIWEVPVRYATQTVAAIAGTRD